MPGPRSLILPGDPDWINDQGFIRRLYELTHHYSDVDISKDAIHHTIGPKGAAAYLHKHPEADITNLVTDITNINTSLNTARSYIIPFNIAAPAVNTLWGPAFFCPFAGTIKSAQFRINGGSGSTFQVYNNGAAPTGMSTSSAATGATQTHNFTDFAVAAGDYLQIFTVGAGTNAQNLSVTILGSF